MKIKPYLESMKRVMLLSIFIMALGFFGIVRVHNIWVRAALCSLLILAVYIIPNSFSAYLVQRYNDRLGAEIDDIINTLRKFDLNEKEIEQVMKKIKK